MVLHVAIEGREEMERMNEALTIKNSPNHTLFNIQVNYQLFEMFEIIDETLTNSCFGYIIAVISINMLSFVLVETQI